MSTKFELDGGWVLLRDTNEITERGRRALRHVMFRLAEIPGMDTVVDLATAEGNDAENIGRIASENQDAIRAHMGEGMRIVDEMQDASIMARLKEWSFSDENGVTLPIVAESLLDLPGTAYDRLKELCKDLPTGLDLEPSPDPKAPTPSITD